MSRDAVASGVGTGRLAVLNPIPPAVIYALKSPDARLYVGEQMDVFIKAEPEDDR